MSALATNRDTAKRQTDQLVGPPVKGGVVIYQGALVALGAGVGAGEFAQPASTSTSLFVLGRATRKVDNSDGSDGDLTVNVERGIFRWDNADSIAAADIGKPAYIVDDHSVSKGSTGKSLAGMIVDVDANGVWVWTSPDAVALVAAVSTTANAAVPMASIQFVNGQTLVAGDVTVSTANITANSVIVPLRMVPDATAAHWGALSITSPTPGAPGSFHIHSASATDTSVCGALIIG